MDIDRFMAHLNSLQNCSFVNLVNIKKFVINRCSIAGPWQMGKIDQGTYWLFCHFFGKELKIHWFFWEWETGQRYFTYI